MIRRSFLVLISGALTLALVAGVDARKFGVPTNAALKALSAATGATVRRSGFYAAGDGPVEDYTLSSSPCSLNSGIGDNGTQVQAQDGGCWNLNAGSSSPSPLVWGAKGDGTTNDTAAVQAAIDGASCILGVPLSFDAQHLYNIASSLTMRCPGSLIGPYRYGIWVTAVRLNPGLLPLIA